jgi:hypothetical protein
VPIPEYTLHASTEGFIVRVLTCILTVLVAAAPALAAEPPLRHVEYTVSTNVDGRATTSRLVLDLIATTNDRGVSLTICEPDLADPVRVDLDKHGVATIVPLGAAREIALTREAKLLVYFFALGAQNLTGMGRGDEWAADGATGDGALHRTRFRVVRSAGAGRLDIAFTRDLELSGERTGYQGRLVYDAFKVVPLSVDARGAVQASEPSGSRTHDVRLALTLVKDSQP